jgi:putative flippase GtrA
MDTVHLRRKVVTLLGRYILSGGIGAAVNIGGLYILSDVFKMHYLIGSTISFVLSLIVSFLLQKNFTFQNSEHDSKKITAQFSMFAVVALINVIINEILLYFFVHELTINHIYAAILSSAIIAVESFFAYRYLIFLTPKKAPTI